MEQCERNGIKRSIKPKWPSTWLAEQLIASDSEVSKVSSIFLSPLFALRVWLQPMENAFYDHFRFRRPVSLIRSALSRRRVVVIGWGGRRGLVHAVEPAGVDRPSDRPQEAQAILKIPNPWAGEGVPLQCVRVQTEALGAREELELDRTTGRTPAQQPRQQPHLISLSLSPPPDRLKSGSRTAAWRTRRTHSASRRSRTTTTTPIAIIIMGHRHNHITIRITWIWGSPCRTTARRYISDQWRTVSAPRQSWAIRISKSNTHTLLRSRWSKRE